MGYRLADYNSSKPCYAYAFVDAQPRPYGEGFDVPTLMVKDGAIGYGFTSFFGDEETKLLKQGKYEELMLQATTSYGLSPDVKWDGEYMYAPRTSLAKMNEWAKKLDPILDGLPEVPAGYLGWFLKA